MTRHFGNPSGRPALGGASDRPSAYRAETPRELHPMPAHSIREPFTTYPELEGAERNRSFATGVFVAGFVSVVFGLPLILAGIMSRFQ